MPTKKLDEKAQRAIVVRLAGFDTPSEVVEFVRENFGVPLQRQSIEYYDPNKNLKLSRKWVELFNTERAAFLAEERKEPCYHRPYRMKLRQSAIERVKKNPKALQGQLDAAAREAGGMFTNRREVTGKDGKELIPSSDPSQWSNEQLEAVLAAHGQLLDPDMTKLRPAYASAPGTASDPRTFADEKPASSK